MKHAGRGLAGMMALVLACSCGLAAQSKSPDDLAPGRILVAAANEPDPLFARTVILLVRYDETGALGLIVNRQSKVPIAQALSDMKEAAKDSDPVFVGGPVDLHRAFALVRAGHNLDGAKRVTGDVYFVVDTTALEKQLKKPEKPNEFRVYVGYSGWGPRQLDTEVLDGRWYIFPGNQEVAFDAIPSTLWLRLIGKTEGQIAWLGGIASAGR